MKALPQKYLNLLFKRLQTHFYVENMNFLKKNSKVYIFTLEYKN